MFAQHPTVGIAIESEERLAPEKGVHACWPSRVVVIAGGLGMLGDYGCGSVGLQIGEVVVPCPVEQSDELFARRPDGLAVGEPSPVCSSDLAQSAKVNESIATAAFFMVGYVFEVNDLQI